MLWHSFYIEGGAFSHGNSCSEILSDDGQRRKHHKSGRSAAPDSAHPVQTAHSAGGGTGRHTVSSKQASDRSYRRWNASAPQSGGDCVPGRKDKGGF